MCLSHQPQQELSWTIHRMPMTLRCGRSACIRHKSSRQLSRTASQVSMQPRLGAMRLCTRIVVHPKFPGLVGGLLAHKREHGSPSEKELYTESWTWQRQVARLVDKRPLVFMGHTDYTILRDGTNLSGNSTAEWDRVGSHDESQTYTFASRSI